MTATCRVDRAEIIKVIRVDVIRGLGTEHQPYRTVTEYWTLDGQKLVEHDPFITEQARGGAR